DKVVATDPKTGETRVETVTAEIKGQGLKHLVKVTIDVDGKAGTKTAQVTATDGHPFWVPELGAWVNATDLKSGEWLQTSAGTYVQITAVERWTALGATVHNLTVGDTHTYYVVARATPVLVHNSNCPTAEERAHARASETAARSSNPGGSSGTDGATGGFLWIEGHGTFDLVSSRPYPGYRPPAGVADGYATHVEAQAAALMHHFQAQNARLMITHPNGVCGTCASTIRAMLPTGAELTVRFQHGRRFFTGGVFVGD
ncbi:polymorphic toxin-type HINT domain-containing protein, partial [Streptomyces sp. ME08-AFT2]|uniref:polymorphic toxin-type HINT domain-containing protein n=1 Tax=Streptomyces sp. ME08-AFT2 TaxID=3028683 RepID=UPI0029B097AF